MCIDFSFFIAVLVFIPLRIWGTNKNEPVIEFAITHFSWDICTPQLLSEHHALNQQYYWSHASTRCIFLPKNQPNFCCHQPAFDKLSKSCILSSWISETLLDDTTFLIDTLFHRLTGAWPPCLYRPYPDLVTFTEEILNWKLHFLCSVICFSVGIGWYWTATWLIGMDYSYLVSCYYRWITAQKQFRQTK